MSSPYHAFGPELIKKIESVPTKWDMKGKLAERAKAGELVPAMGKGMIYCSTWPGTKTTYFQHFYSFGMSGSFSISGAGSTHTGVMSLHFSGGDDTPETADRCVGTLGYVTGSYAKQAVAITGTRDAKTGEWNLKMGKFQGTVRDLTRVPVTDGTPDVREYTGKIDVKVNILAGAVHLSGPLTLVLAQCAQSADKCLHATTRALTHLA